MVVQVRVLELFVSVSYRRITDSREVAVRIITQTIYSKNNFPDSFQWLDAESFDSSR